MKSERAAGHKALSLSSKGVTQLSRHARLIELMGMLVVLYSWTLNLDGFETYRAAQDDLKNLVAQTSRGQAQMMSAAIQSSSLDAGQPFESSATPVGEPRSDKQWDSADVRRDWLERSFAKLLLTSAFVESLQKLHIRHDVPADQVGALKKALDSTQQRLRPFVEVGRTANAPQVSPKDTLTPARAQEFEASLTQQVRTAFDLVTRLKEALQAKRAHHRFLYRLAFVCGTLLLALGKFFDWRSSLRTPSTP